MKEKNLNTTFHACFRRPISPTLLVRVKSSCHCYQSCHMVEPFFLGTALPRKKKAKLRKPITMIRYESHSTLTSDMVILIFKYRYKNPGSMIYIYLKMLFSIKRTVRSVSTYNLTTSMIHIKVIF